MSKVAAKRGDIFYAELSPVVGSEQGGIRPVLIIQNNIGNYYSPTVVIAAITARSFKAKLPTHVEVKAKETKLEKDSIILLEQIRTIDKKRLKDRVTHLNQTIMHHVNQRLSLSVGLINSGK